MTQVISADSIRSTLQSNICKVTFTKTNGELREMVCTLRDDIVVPHEKKTERVKEVNESVMAVWDCEKNAWRSFRVDSIIEVFVNSEKDNAPA